MRIDDFGDVQDLMKVRAAQQAVLAEIDDKLRALAVVVPKPDTEFDLSVAALKAHGAKLRWDKDGRVVGPYHPDFAHLYLPSNPFYRAPDDGLHADYDAGVPVDGFIRLSPSALLGEDWGAALRDGAQRGTAEIVLRGDGVQKGILPLAHRTVMHWMAKLAAIAERGS